VSRLFVAVWPPPEVIGLLGGLDRPDEATTRVRWTTSDQWHVTLRFLGDVADDRITEVIGALADVAEVAPSTATLGPRISWLGHATIVVPVAGLGALAAVVRDATVDIGDPVDPRPFNGHITLARLKGRGRSCTTGTVGLPVSAEFPVREIALVRSRLHPDGARYETVATVPCDAQGPDV